MTTPYARYMAVKKVKPATLDLCDVSLNKLLLLTAFLCINCVAFAVRMDLAAMMLVPNIFILFRLELVTEVIGMFIATVAMGVVAAISIDNFYILAVHSLFYMTILLVSKQLPGYQRRNTRKEAKRKRR